MLKVCNCTQNVSVTAMTAMTAMKVCECTQISIVTSLEGMLMYTICQSDLA